VCRGIRPLVITQNPSGVRGIDGEAPATEVPVPVTHRCKRLWLHMAHSSRDITS